MPIRGRGEKGSNGGERSQWKKYGDDDDRTGGGGGSEGRLRVCKMWLVIDCGRAPPFLPSFLSLRLSFSFSFLYAPFLSTRSLLTLLHPLIFPAFDRTGATCQFVRPIFLVFFFRVTIGSLPQIPCKFQPPLEIWAGAAPMGGQGEPLSLLSTANRLSTTTIGAKSFFDNCLLSSDRV